MWRKTGGSPTSEGSPSAASTTPGPNRKPAAGRQKPATCDAGAGISGDGSAGISGDGRKKVTVVQVDMDDDEEE
jgi:hypothetical protein